MCTISSTKKCKLYKFTFKFAMLKVLVALQFLPAVLGIIFIDRMRLNFDEKFSNWSINYIHDQAGNAIVNVTFQTNDTVNKALMYLTAKAAKDRNDKDCQIEILNTVIDAGKFLKGMQGHFALRNFLNNILKTMDFDPKFPLPAVSNYINRSLCSS